MRVLLRLAKRTTWSGDRSDPEKRADALASFACRIEDTDGISVYEIASDAERDLVIAAIACERGKDDKVIDLLEIPREIVERHGAIAEPPNAPTGTTPVPAANDLHRSLDWTPASLQALAIELFDAQVQAVRYSKAQIRAALAKLDPNRDVLDGEDEARALVLRARQAAGQ